MNYIRRKTFLLHTAVLMLSLFVANAQSASSENNEKTLNVQFNKGEVIQWIAPISKPEPNEARQRYYQQAIPLAKTFGFDTHGQLKVQQTLVGGFKPPAIIIGSWPSEQAFADFANHPSWPKLKTMRAQAWDELMLFNHTVTQDTTLTFHQDKTYTLAFAWVAPESPNDYTQYLDEVEPLLEQVGARFVWKMRDISMEAHAAEIDPPMQITLVEWDKKNALRDLRNIPEYKKHSALLTSGVRKFEFHLLSPTIVQ